MGMAERGQAEGGATATTERLTDSRYPHKRHVKLTLDGISNFLPIERREMFKIGDK